MPDPRKVLVLGLDGMAFSVLDPLLEGGVMPVLASLAERGARSDLISTVPPVTPPAWSSFLTGKGPGTHGVLDFRRFDPRTRDERLGSSRDVRSATLFTLLSDAGKSVGVVHLPMHYPPPKVNGVVVSGHETPGTDAAFTWPPELREEVLQAVPDYTFHVRVQRGYQSVPEVFRETIGRVIENLRCRGDLAVHLLGTRDLDAFLVHFQSLDALLHFAYEYLDGADEERHALTISCFAEADRQIGRILEAAGDRLVVALSDHGFGGLTGKIFPNVLLEEWGLLRLSPGVRRRRYGPFRRLVEATPLRAVPASLREWKKRRKAARRERGEPTPMREARAEEIARVLPLDWGKTRAYVPVAGTHAFLYLNLMGREPEGAVPPSEYETARRELAERFLAARHPQFPGALFTAARTPEEVWGKSLRETGPDLILFPAEGLNAHRSLLRRPSAYDRNRRSGGTHRMEGVLILAGPGVRRGVRDFPAKIVDVAPTVLRYLDVPVPEDLEGRALTDPFSDLPAERFCPPPRIEESEDGDVYDDEEARAMEERLRGLGYL